MPQYSYTVINKENRELTGSINAPDEAAARQELNTLGFSILSLTSTAPATPNPADDTEETTPSIKFEFSATDKNKKKIVGTIQGEKIFPVYKRLIQEYQFEVEQLYPADLSASEKEKAKLKGTAYLQDLLQEEQVAAQLTEKKQAIDEKEFLEKQSKLKVQVEFVLQKVNTLLTTYQEVLDPGRKAKIKYYVEKILRIKNSTNLDYISQTCEEMLTYIQKEEIFLNQEERLKEKTMLAIDAKSMMMELSRINKSRGPSIVESLQTWRQIHVINNSSPSTTENIINWLISSIIGPTQEAPDIAAARQKIRDNTRQLKEFIILYFQAPDENFKKETKTTILRLWHQRQLDKQDLITLIHKQKSTSLQTDSNTPIEILEMEIFTISGWILAFYIGYYFLTIYLNSKQIGFLGDTSIGLIFQTSIIKYFFTTLFLFVCLLGIKIEFFRKKPFVTPIFLIIFLISSSLIILNF